MAEVFRTADVLGVLFAWDAETNTGLAAGHERLRRRVRASTIPTRSSGSPRSIR